MAPAMASIIFVIWIIISIGSIGAGIFYIIQCKRIARIQRKAESSPGTQEQVTVRRDIYGITNRGVSMDKRDIYIVDFQYFGIE